MCHKDVHRNDSLCTCQEFFCMKEYLWMTTWSPGAGYAYKRALGNEFLIYYEREYYLVPLWMN